MKNKYGFCIYEFKGLPRGKKYNPRMDMFFHPETTCIRHSSLNTSSEILSHDCEKCRVPNDVDDGD